MSEPAADQTNAELADALRRVVLAVEASGRALLPESDKELLQTIVEAAAHIFGAAAASIALLDPAGEILEFRVSYGAGSEEVVGMRIPAGQGIAGYVASTGQPMAISDVQQDPHFARQTAEQTGYVPRSILATPLLLGDRVIGVMEVLDKINAASFGMQDMELLGLFARQAAIAIHSSQQYSSLGDALLQQLEQLAGTDAARPIRRTLAAGDEGAEDVLAIADVFRSISELGEPERKACLQVLQAFAGYARSRASFVSAFSWRA